MLTFPSHSLRTIATLLAAVAPCVAGGAGVAGAQGGASGMADAATAVGGRLQLSERALAPSQPRSGDEEGYIVIRDGRGTAGSLAEKGYRMSAGAWGLWTDDPAPFGADPGAARREPGLDRLRLGTESPSADGGFEGLITYYTPRYEGVQFEGAYSSRHLRDDTIAAPSANGTYLGAVALGANLDRASDGFGIGVAVGYSLAESPDDDAIPELAAWNVGFRIDFEGLRFDGAYTKQDDARADETGALASGSGSGWHVGARYRWGANGISLSYSRVESLPVVALPGDDKDAARLSYAREIGPGVKWSVNGVWADRTGVTAGGPDDIDGMGLATSIRLSF